MTRSTSGVETSKMREELLRAGVRSVIGTVVNAAGITLAKRVPLARLDTFCTSGLGAAPVWHVFGIDGGIAFTDTISAVGDLRLRLDLDATRSVGGGLAWGPADFLSQDGVPDPACTRGLLAQVEQRLAGAGLAALVGHELEFVLVSPDGSKLPDTAWVPYGATGQLDREAFLDDLLVAAEVAGVEVAQLHCEYGRDQFEFSLAPASPVKAADTAVLARLIVGRVARAHRLRASFSPIPFAGSVGNGAHQHFSLIRGGASLFAGGARAHGITQEGGYVIGGVLRHLPDVQGLLTGSVLSGARLAPGMWSGVAACWGLENREAAVRFVKTGPADPQGANFEVKIVDPSANVYAASAAILSVALEGIRLEVEPPAEVLEDPSKLDAQQRKSAGIATLSNDMTTVVDTLEHSEVARSLLGDAVIDSVVAVRRHEQAQHGAKSPEELADLFRLAWSV